MSVKIENTPSPSVLMNSMRSIGYTFRTASMSIKENVLLNDIEADEVAIDALHKADFVFIKNRI